MSYTEFNQNFHRRGRLPLPPPPPPAIRFVPVVDTELTNRFIDLNEQYAKAEIAVLEDIRIEMNNLSAFLESIVL